MSTFHTRAEAALRGQSLPQIMTESFMLSLVFRRAYAACCRVFNRNLLVYRNLFELPSQSSPYKGSIKILLAALLAWQIDFLRDRQRRSPAVY